MKSNGKQTIFKSVCDSVARLEMFRGDAETGLYAADLVRMTIRELFRHEFTETKWTSGGLVTIATDIAEGLSEYGFNEIAHSGRAARIGPNASDVPQADVQGQRTLRPVHDYGVHIQYTRKDLRRSRLQGMFDIAQEKAAAAREAHDLTMNDLIRSGELTSSLYGMTNHPGIQVANAVTGTWSSATAAQIVADFVAAVSGMTNSTDNLEMPNTALFSVANYTRISTLQNSNASDATVLDYLKKAFPFITTWDWEAGLSTSDAAGGPCCLIYRKDRSRQRVVMPMVLRPYPPEARGYAFKIYFESEFGGVMMPRPKAVLRLDGV